MVFCDSRVLVRNLASPFGHPTQVSTQVQLASTYDYLPVRLTRALAMDSVGEHHENGFHFNLKFCGPKYEFVVVFFSVFGK